MKSTHSIFTVLLKSLKFIGRYCSMGLIVHWMDKPSRGLAAIGVILGLLSLSYLPSTLPTWCAGYSPEARGLLLHGLVTLQTVGSGLALLFIVFLGTDIHRLHGLHQRNNQLAERMNTIRDMGKEGEIETSTLIQSLRDKMHLLNRSASWMPADAGIKDIVLLNQSKTHSQEVDELIIVDNHIFLIEVKHWQGAIRAQGDQLLVNDELRKSPEVQSYSKIERIKQQLSKDGVDAKVYPVYVFTHPKVELDAELPWNYVKLNNLEGYFKFMRKEVWQADLDFVLAQHYLSEATNSVMKLLDTRPDAKHHHLLFLASRPNPTSQLEEYAALHQQVKNNEMQLNQFNLHASFQTAMKWLAFASLVVIPAAWFITNA